MKHRLLLLLSLALTVLSTACGGSTVDFGDPADGGETSDSAKGNDADAGGVCGEPVVLCSTGCGGTSNPICEDGAWVCPTFGGPVCIEDAAVADASCPLVPIHCASGCGGPAPDPVCVAGSWVCPVPNHKCPVFDAGRGPLACGSLSCNGATQYCAEIGGGPAPPDGGSNTSYNCDTIPAQCQPSPTCACVQQAAGSPSCTCTDGPNGISIACFYQ